MVTLHIQRLTLVRLLFGSNVLIVLIPLQRSWMVSLIIRPISHYSLHFLRPRATLQH
jgi:hypothetical protein